MDFDSESTAFIFPGQGSQFVGMGLELARSFDLARLLFQEADSILGIPLSRIMWEGPGDVLNETINTQPALFVHSFAAFRILMQRSPGISPACFAGHSLGELTAITAAGALSFIDGLRLVRRRGELMKRAGEITQGGMAAIIGLEIPELEEICAEASTGMDTVQVANDNCPGQVVISGSKPALGRAMDLVKAAGARRTIPLAVSIAAHSPLMKSVQEDFTVAVNSAPFSMPDKPVISNVYARPMTTIADIRTDLRAQLTSRVRWTESVKYMIEKGMDTFIELGSGSVLTGLIKRINNQVTGISLGSFSDFNN